MFLCIIGGLVERKRGVFECYFSINGFRKLEDSYSSVTFFG